MSSVTAIFFAHTDLPQTRFQVFRVNYIYYRNRVDSISAAASEAENRKAKQVSPYWNLVAVRTIVVVCAIELRDAGFFETGSTCLGGYIERKLVERQAICGHAAVHRLAIEIDKRSAASIAIP